MALYQQGVQRIEVIVRGEGVLGGQVGAKEKTTDNASTSASATDPNTTSKAGMSARKKRILKTNATHVLATTRQVTLLGANYIHTGLGMANGDDAFQDNVQRKLEVLSDSSGILAAGAMGALYGSWGGPLGTVVGGALGVISTSASMAFKYKGREREYNYKVMKEQNAINYNISRSQINWTNGRLR